MDFKNFNYLLFDLDGTLTDSQEGIFNCVQFALNELGVDVGNKEKLFSFIGPPLKDEFMRSYGFDEEKAVLAVELYRKRYSTVGLYENRVYDGIIELLSKLQNNGKKLIIATSKPEPYAKSILEHFDLLKYFSFIGGALFNKGRSHKEEVISYVLKENNIKISEAVMIGDRMHDVKGATLNNIPCIGVLYGYGSKDELINAGVKAIAQNVKELEELLM